MASVRQLPWRILLSCNNNKKRKVEETGSERRTRGLSQSVSVCTSVIGYFSIFNFWGRWCGCRWWWVCGRMDRRLQYAVALAFFFLSLSRCSWHHPSGSRVSSIIWGCMGFFGPGKAPGSSTPIFLDGEIKECDNDMTGYPSNKMGMLPFACSNVQQKQL